MSKDIKKLQGNIILINYTLYNFLCKYFERIHR